jgi:hypothetical protein
MDDTRLAEMFRKTAVEASDVRCSEINDALFEAAQKIIKRAPKCADLSHAIRLLRQAMRTAQDAVLLKGVV